MAQETGYPKLARLMSLEPQTAIFRRFGQLTMLNLLRLQAELHDLERQLGEIREEDEKSGDPIRTKYVDDFRLMRDWIEDGDSLQYELLLSIGQKLQEYHSTLLNALQVSKAPNPTRREHQFLDMWLQRPDMGANFLNDPEESIWAAHNLKDFVTLRSSEADIDVFTSALNGSLTDVYHHVWGKRRKRNQSVELGKNVRRYDDTHILRFSKIVSSIASSLLPALTILVLYFVERMIVRIGLVIVFTTIFSLTLTILTEARKVDVFSATAAFAAVEVVFVGSTAVNGTVG